ncbi:holin [Jeotgalibacillus haloalkalitolerans]|uniref:Holin n=1 Tax=Jeotgalibacillus haloalkalitolerans TaxID=3104292 RepID=A0ABU5KNC5_9BACL|nr:holin [Jeotgalibacillus sp. HH7-29]MDZ5712231.1 holin [Jeotgalibacillus sp. HH7-29]
MRQTLSFGTVLLPIILALVEGAKKSFPIKKNLIPTLAVVIGLFIGFAASPFTDLDVTLRLWAGGLAGLSATGLFEVFNIRKGVTKGGEA